MLAEEYDFYAQYFFLIRLIDRTNIPLCRRYMYLARIRKWSLFKNLKAHEKEQFAEAELNYLNAAGEPPSQFLHQRLVRRDKVERHLRHKTKEMNGSETRDWLSMIRISLRLRISYEQRKQLPPSCQGSTEQNSDGTISSSAKTITSNWQ